MAFYDDYLAKIENPDHRQKMAKVLRWVEERYPNLVGKIAWNQPMFTDHGTFIIGFSVAQKHFAFAGEDEIIAVFGPEFDRLGLFYGKKLVRVSFDQEVPYDLLAKVIEYNIADKQDCQTFWRPRAK